MSTAFKGQSGGFSEWLNFDFAIGGMNQEEDYCKQLPPTDLNRLIREPTLFKKQLEFQKQIEQKRNENKVNR